MGDIANVNGGQGYATDIPDAATSYEPIPPGWYPVYIEAARVQPTKNGNGQVLKVDLQVVGDAYKGRKLFPRINLANPNQTAVEIGMREMAALGLACGLSSVSDTSELVGKTVEARVKIRPAHGTYEADNEVSGYRACGSAERAPAHRAAAPIQAGTAAAVHRPARPWER